MSDTQADIEYLSQNTINMINPPFIIQNYGTPNTCHGEYQTHSIKVLS